MTQPDPQRLGDWKLLAKKLKSQNAALRHALALARRQLREYRAALGLEEIEE